MKRVLSSTSVISNNDYIPYHILKACNEFYDLYGLVNDIQLQILKSYYTINVILDGYSQTDIYRRLYSYFIRNKDGDDVVSMVIGTIIDLYELYGFNISFLLIKKIIYESNVSIEDIKKINGMTILHYAVNSYYSDIIRLILKLVDNPYTFSCMTYGIDDCTALHISIYLNRVDIAIILLDNTQNTTDVHKMIYMKYKEMNCLQLAFKSDSYDISEILDAYIKYEYGSQELKAVINKMLLPDIIYNNHIRSQPYHDIINGIDRNRFHSSYDFASRIKTFYEYNGYDIAYKMLTDIFKHKDNSLDDIMKKNNITPCSLLHHFCGDITYIKFMIKLLDDNIYTYTDSLFIHSLGNPKSVLKYAIKSGSNHIPSVGVVIALLEIYTLYGNKKNIIMNDYLIDMLRFIPKKHGDLITGIFNIRDAYKEIHEVINAYLIYEIDSPQLENVLSKYRKKKMEHQ